MLARQATLDAEREQILLDPVLQGVASATRQHRRRLDELCAQALGDCLVGHLIVDDVDPAPSSGKRAIASATPRLASATA